MTDPTDTHDLDAVNWAEERAIRQHEADRLLTDGRRVQPMTFDDMRAEKAAAMAAQAARFADVFAAPTDWTWGDEWGRAS